MFDLRLYQVELPNVFRELSLKFSYSLDKLTQNRQLRLSGVILHARNINIVFKGSKTRAMLFAPVLRYRPKVLICSFATKRSLCHDPKSLKAVSWFSSRRRDCSLCPSSFIAKSLRSQRVIDHYGLRQLTFLLFHVTFKQVHITYKMSSLLTREHESILQFLDHDMFQGHLSITFDTLKETAFILFTTSCCSSVSPMSTMFMTISLMLRAISLPTASSQVDRIDGIAVVSVIVINPTKPIIKHGQLFGSRFGTGFRYKLLTSRVGVLIIRPSWCRFSR